MNHSERLLRGLLFEVVAAIDSSDGLPEEMLASTSGGVIVSRTTTQAVGEVIRMQEMWNG